ncbi:peptidase M10 [Lentilactobacillus curieae]|uniref:Peptidase M10 n=1 Tax=Lentilactobacillus curieae TaxID=1138822 RepID=A0A1S6QHI6_9LACO|nr:matrixin family metalloprotease [Lentilactobacillus curieae]AQW21074.1 peptidase M10 [Lentilactobacillus curieae]
MAKFKNRFLLLVTAAFSFGAVLIGVTGQTAQAKTKSVKIIKTKKFDTKKFRATKGYIYSSAKLTKKVHNADNYPKTVFYVNKQVTVKKTNGKNAVYYYVQNKSKKVKGYIWRGYMIQIPSKKVVANSESATDNNQVSAEAAEQMMSAGAMSRLIDEAPDMNPSDAILNLSANEYNVYGETLNKAYNIIKTSPSGMFNNHTATIYVENSRLVPYVQQAIEKWNSAMEQTVFKLGTRNNHTLEVKLVNASNSDWDGMYNGQAVYIDASRFLNPRYPTAYLSQQKAAQITPSTYWVGVMTHELGHTLGLDHTGYQSDLMYASSSEGNAVAKYSWKTPVERSSTGLDGTENGGTFTDRDINRAKLAQKLGYW